MEARTEARPLPVVTPADLTLEEILTPDAPRVRVTPPLTQKDVVLADLKAASPGWVCATLWLEKRITRAAARIADLKAAGHRIASRRCEQHSHAVAEYRLVTDGDPDPDGGAPGMC